VATGAVLAASTAAQFATRDAGNSAAAQGSALAGAASALALTHVTVIDATGARPARDMTVLIQNGLIEVLGRTSEVRLAPSVQTVDLTGKFVIPGLIESHVHSAGPAEVLAPLYALTGITTVREMRGELFHHQWRDQIRSGRLLGPRWIIGSPIIDGIPSLHTHDTGSLIEVNDESGARGAVRQAKRDGADFVKVYSRLEPNAYLAIVDESRRQGIPVAGHCPDEMQISRISELGQVSIEHLHALLLATSSREDEIRRGLAAITIDGTQDSFHRYASWFQQVHPLEHEAVRSYHPDKANALFDLLAANRTRVVPTLAVHHTLELPDENPAHADEWKYLPTWMVDWWPDVTGVVVDGRTPEQARQIREIYAHRERLVRQMQQSGVSLLAGTDTGLPYLVPGFALHKELSLLVEAGLTPLQALQSATREPARLFGLADKIGTVEAGKAADLVVLNADPLHDIRNTKNIHALVVNGRLIDQPERQRLLTGVEQAAASSEPPAAATTVAAGCGCGVHPG
jgi:imidazolonepropionase-like amidohydrolase